jgi:prephenate dehydrogenase
MRVGIIGGGDFGRFMAGHLAKHAEVLVHDQREVELPEGVGAGTLGEVIHSDVVVLAVPVQALEEVLQQIGPQLEPGTLVCDVCSVKTIPAKLMRQYVPEGCEIIATHPLFGPQSGANGLMGLPMAIWAVRVKHERYEALRGFLKSLGLHVMEVSPDQHDRQMAYVQALTFYVGKAFERMDIPETPLKTATYQHLLDIDRLVATNSPALNVTIQQFNPYAREVREQLVRELETLERELKN